MVYKILNVELDDKGWLLPVTVITAMVAVFVYTSRILSKQKKEKKVSQEYMKAAILRQFGSDVKLEIIEIPKPQMEENEVLIRISAVSLNPIDVLNQTGYGKSLRKVFKEKDKAHILPIILGRDGSGLVEAVGKKVSRIKPGDEVWFTSRFWQQGSLTEYISIKDIFVTKKPFNLSYIEAASIPYVALTTWNALVTKAKLTPNNTAGKRILIHAGTGGIGSFAMQLVKAWGGHVTTTCNSNAMDFVKKLGADDVIDYTKDIVTILKNKEKFDIVLNTIKQQDEITLDVCKQGGYVITLISFMIDTLDTYGLIVGAIIDIYLVLRILLVQKFYRKINYRWAFYKPTVEGLETIKELCEQNKISPVIDKVYSFQDVNKGLEHLRKGHSRGKTVIKIKD